MWGALDETDLEEKSKEGGDGLVLRNAKVGVTWAAALVSLMLALPAAAMAEEPPPKGYSNNKEIALGTRLPIIAWGEITLHSSVLGKIHCLNTFFAEGWNAHEKLEGSKPERGYGEVLGWGNSNCEAPEEIKSLEVAHEKEIKEGKIEAPLTVTATAEMPLEKVGKQGEICKEETKTLEQCTNKTLNGKSSC